MNSCSRHTCFVPDTGCDLGHLKLADCPVWSTRAEMQSSSEEDVVDGFLPWSGSALGLSDIGFIAGRVRPFVVGIAGTQNAGKTTLLGAWYLLTCRGLTSNSARQFSGS